jgi:hypothetical protein
MAGMETVPLPGKFAAIQAWACVDSGIHILFIFSANG